MTRPRIVTVADCDRCDWDSTHRAEHLYDDMRRRRWRAQKRLQRHPGSRGYLHDLSCDGPTFCTCTPIPVYQ